MMNRSAAEHEMTEVTDLVAVDGSCFLSGAQFSSLSPWAERPLPLARQAVESKGPTPGNRRCCSQPLFRCGI